MIIVVGLYLGWFLAAWGMMLYLRERHLRQCVQATMTDLGVMLGDLKLTMDTEQLVIQEVEQHHIQLFGLPHAS